MKFLKIIAFASFVLTASSSFAQTATAVAIGNFVDQTLNLGISSGPAGVPDPPSVLIPLLTASDAIDSTITQFSTSIKFKNTVLQATGFAFNQVVNNTGTPIPLGQNIVNLNSNDYEQTLVKPDFYSFATNIQNNFDLVNQRGLTRIAGASSTDGIFKQFDEGVLLYLVFNVVSDTADAGLLELANCDTTICQIFPDQTGLTPLTTDDFTDGNFTTNPAWFQHTNIGQDSIVTESGSNVLKITNNGRMFLSAVPFGGSFIDISVDIKEINASNSVYWEIGLRTPDTTTPGLYLKPYYAFKVAPTSVKLQKVTATATIDLDTYTPSAPSGNYHNYRMIRFPNGQLNVYKDGNLILDAIDKNPVVTDGLFLSAGGFLTNDGAYFDNVQVFHSRMHCDNIVTNSSGNTTVTGSNLIYGSTFIDVNNQNYLVGTDPLPVDPEFVVAGCDTGLFVLGDTTFVSFSEVDVPGSGIEIPNGFTYDGFGAIPEPTLIDGLFLVLGICVGNDCYLLPTSLEEIPQFAPEGFALSQNYPNPFNPTTTIAFKVPETQFTTVKIYNTLGEEVKTLVNAKTQANIPYVTKWDGKDNNGKQVASGIYFYKMVSGNYTQTKKMVLLK
ncbi:T9SS type A sorting domain-containing protein [bacterium]|nr:T9SS type A sorting domain-containing protein [bacterium]